MRASPSLDRVMVLTYITFSKGFNSYKDIKTHIGEAMKYYKSWQRDKSNLILKAYAINTLFVAPFPRFFFRINLFFRKIQKMFDK